MARLLDLVDCCVCPKAEQHVHHFSLQVVTHHGINPLLALLLRCLNEEHLLGWQQETCLGDCDLYQLREEELDLA